MDSVDGLEWIDPRPLPSLLPIQYPKERKHKEREKEIRRGWLTLRDDLKYCIRLSNLA